MCDEISEGKYQEQMGMIDELHRDALRSRHVRDEADTWVTREGQVLRIADMGDQHLINTVQMLRRNVEGMRCQTLSNMWNYMENAPDGAYDACESAQVEIEGSSREEYLMVHCAPYPSLLREVERRRLTLPPLPTEDEIQKAALIFSARSLGILKGGGAGGGKTKGLTKRYLWLSRIFGVAAKLILPHEEAANMMNKLKLSHGQTHKLNTRNSNSSSRLPMRGQGHKKGKRGK